MAALALEPFRPSTITPPPEPLGFFGALRAITDNPITIWPEALYRERVYIGQMGGQRFVHVASPELAQGVLLDHADAFIRAKLATRLLKPALGEGLLTSEGETWRRQRRIAAPAFRVKALRALVPVMSAAGRCTADRLATAPGLVDVMPAMTQATLDVIVDTMLRVGGPGIDRDALARNVGVYIESSGTPDLLDAFNAPRWLKNPLKWRGRAAVRRLREAARQAVLAAQAPSEGDATLTELLVAAADPETGGRMTEPELIDNIVTFISAGHETTALALTWSLYLLAQAPALQEALAAEAAAVAGGAPIDAGHVDALTLHAQVIDEAMRLYPPAALVGRSAQRDVTLEDADGPLEIRRGDEVAVATYVMHRHHALWEDPSAFRLGREPKHRFAYLPFGAGPRICIGLRFAMMEAVAILASMTPRLRFAPGPARKVEPVMRITLRPKGGMPLAIAPR